MSGPSPQQAESERRAKSLGALHTLIETRTETLSLLNQLAGMRPFAAAQDAQLVLKEFCETVVDYTASATFKMIVGGAALQMDYSGDFEGMPFVGIGINTFDREENQWQQVWFDNFGARISLYTGQKVDGKYVYEGEDKYEGQTMHGRITISDITDDSFEWAMDQSMDGENWWTGITATYTRK